MKTKNSTSPTTVSDADLDDVSGGRSFGEGINGPLKAKFASFVYDEDGNLARKTLIAPASGGGSVAGGYPTGNSYTFDEIIDGEYVKTTYQVE